MSPERTTVEVEGRTLSLSNLEKVLYPSTGFTKGDLIAYYFEVAPFMLAHIASRPLTLKRYPDGVDGESFYEKHVPRHVPEWLSTATVPRRVRDDRGATIRYAVVNELAALIWAANLATIEFHTPMWKVDAEQASPLSDLLVFDLDPGPATSLLECCEVAVLIKAELLSEGLASMPKTSGKKGLQLYASLERPQPWEKMLDFAHEIAQRIERARNDLVVTNMRKQLRDQRVLIDWSQNNAAKTTIAPYSLRGEAEPSASTPLTWKEIDDCLSAGSADRLRFLASDVIARVHEFGDLMAPGAPKASTPVGGQSRRRP